MRESIPDISVTDATIAAIREILLEWGREHYKDYPWRNPDQPWHGLVAEILLQRTKANNVIPVYQDFVKRFPTPESLALATETEIESVIYPLGLRWRIPLLKKLGEQLILLNGKLPQNVEDLRKLSGVGAYVAAAWAGFHANVRAVIIDANVVRWLCRLFDMPVDGETRRKKWLIELADRFTPEYNSKVYNYAVLDFSMEICTPVPECTLCPIGERFCLYRKKQLMQEAEEIL